MYKEEQKQNTDSIITNKKYSLSFFGVNPDHDWIVLFNFGVVLLITASLLYYFDNKNIKKRISEDSFVMEDKNYFDIKRAKVLLNKLEAQKTVDQSL